MRAAARARRGAAVALLLLSTGAPAVAQEPATVRGRVVLAVEGARLRDVGPVVVYLVPVDAAAPVERAPETSPQIHQRSARFTPGFLAVAVGQNIRMPNDDAIYHNVFSYSRGNQFDLGLYPSGESRSVTFDRPGVVKIYCSIHESMNGTIFVAPGPHFAQVSAGGRFLLRGVPPGRYELRTWCERLPETRRVITLPAGAEIELEVPLGAEAAG